MSLTLQKFRKVMGNFTTGVTVITTQDLEGKPYGVTVNSFTSVSLDPLWILVCLDRQLSNVSAFEKGKYMGINILTEEQKAISTHFATRGSDRTRSIYEIGETGIPLLRDTLASLECKIVEEYPGGDHVILVGEVKSAHINPHAAEKKPLVFFRGRYHHLC